MRTASDTREYYNNNIMFVPSEIDIHWAATVEKYQIFAFILHSLTEIIILFAIYYVYII